MISITLDQLQLKVSHVLLGLSDGILSLFLLLYSMVNKFCLVSMQILHGREVNSPSQKKVLLLLSPELFLEYLIEMKCVCFSFFYCILPSETNRLSLSPAGWQDFQFFFHSLNNFLCSKETHKGAGTSAFSVVVSDPYHSYTTEKCSLPLSSSYKKLLKIK